MHDIIGMLSESAKKGLKCKHRHRLISKKICLYAWSIRRIAHVCSGCDSDKITAVVVIPEAIFLPE